jgi:hypothetical protein
VSGFEGEEWQGLGRHKVEAWPVLRSEERQIGFLFFFFFNRITAVTIE